MTQTVADVTSLVPGNNGYRFFTHLFLNAMHVYTVKSIFFLHKGAVILNSLRQHCEIYLMRIDRRTQMG